MSGTTDFSRKLDAIKPVPDNAYWVSVDVKSFYKSIPNAEEIKAVNESFDNHTSKHAATHLIFLAPILNVTLCSTANTIFKEKGCVTDHLEKKYIYSFFQRDPLIYLRFTEGLFLI